MIQREDAKNMHGARGLSRGLLSCGASATIEAAAARTLQKRPMIMLTRDRQFYKQIFRLTGFIALQNVIASFVGLADNVMIGAYSQDALSGVALANQVQYLLQMLAGGIGEGMAVIAAQYWGTRRLQPIRQVLSIALVFALGVATLFFGLAHFAPQGLLSLLTGDAGAIAEGAAYMRITAFSYFFFCATMILLAAQRSVENVSVGIYASLSGLVVKILLNWLLIFGDLGFPRLGTQGAAISTLIGRMVEFGVCLLYTYRVDHKLAIGFAYFKKLDKPLLRDFYHYGTPVVMASSSWGVAMLLQTAILGHMGSNAIAANAIANSLFQVISVVLYGISSASGVMIGKVVGKGDLGKLKEYVKTLQWLFLAVGLVSAAALYLCKDGILELYQVSPAALGMANGFMIAQSVTVIGSAYQSPVLSGVVRGGGNTKFVFYNDLIFMWGIVLPMSFLGAFVFHWDPVTVFCCLKADQVLKCFVAVWEVNSYRWVRRVTRDEAAALVAEEAGEIGIRG